MPATKNWKMGRVPHKPTREVNSLVRAGHAPGTWTPTRPWRTAVRRENDGRDDDGACVEKGSGENIISGFNCA